MILYSFRRCPWAMRARLALRYAGCEVNICEVAMKNKPAALLALSPKGTVPVLDTGVGVLEESLDIMRWALTQHDPEGWLHAAPLDDMLALIAHNDGPFKQLLDRYKYADRHPEQPAHAWRDQAVATHLANLEARLQRHPSLLQLAEKLLMHQFDDATLVRHPH